MSATATAGVEILRNQSPGGTVHIGTVSDELRLPIEFGPVSNGEYDPRPLSEVAREAIRRARIECLATADRLAMPRRRFLRSLCAASVVLLSLDACTREEQRARRSPYESSEPGGGFEIPPEATTEPEAAEEAVGGDEFIMDVQGHLLEYDLNPVFHGEGFYANFPQQYCGEDDPRVCYSIEHFLEAFFIRSDTNVVVLSALPIYPEGSPLSPEIMFETRRIVEGLCRDERVMLHGQVLPNVGSLDSVLDGMEQTAQRYPVVAWKTFTHFPDFFDPGGGAWWLDDHESGLPQVGEPFIRKSVDLGIRTICVHKGFSGGSRYSSPIDVGPAARKHKDVNFVVYHSGYESGGFEGPYTSATAEQGVNRLITSLERAGIGPNENVYAELGSTWWNLMRSPTQAAHVLGKLLKHVGEDNVVWGTDCLFYGSPQPQIQALRAFHISRELQERYGYPKLTREIKAKILGLNGARLYGIEPVPPRCDFTRRELAAIREELRGDDGPLGPATLAAAADVREHHRLEVATTA